MGEIINLNRARKTRAKAEDKANRIEAQVRKDPESYERNVPSAVRAADAHAILAQRDAATKDRLAAKELRRAALSMNRQ
jgi:hypothetical protein